jgi:hypothetical protein
MATDANDKSEVTYIEAPASWNTSYVTASGFVCRITLRGENGKDLLQKAGVALAFLIENGYEPEKRHSQERHPRTKHCSIHKCSMKSYEKDGQTWFSHRLHDGNWCTGSNR